MQGGNQSLGMRCAFKWWWICLWLHRQSRMKPNCTGSQVNCDRALGGFSGTTALSTLLNLNLGSGVGLHLGLFLFMTWIWDCSCYQSSADFLKRFLVSAIGNLVKHNLFRVFPSVLSGIQLVVEDI